MACHSSAFLAPLSPCFFFTAHNTNTPNPNPNPYPYPFRLRKLRLFPLAFAAASSSFNGLVPEAVKILIPTARFDASKLKVVETENDYSGIIPRTYILSHCDFTANLTLTISTVINVDQLNGWYTKDDVVAEWKKLQGELCLHIHCYVSGPNLKLDLAAELRYHIFSKEMPLVLQSVLYGDAELFQANPELKDAQVRVYFHSSSPNYNRIECWGPLKDAAQGRRAVEYRNLLGENKVGGRTRKRVVRPRSILQTLFALFL
ncbi:Magnesium dechelatase SGRL, chloroplastic [Linum grandiflorum]